MPNDNLTPRIQLNAYYREQGLTGQALRRAVVSDLRRLRRNTDASRGKGAYLRFAQQAVKMSKDWGCAVDNPIGCLFVWAGSPEGEDYWSVRDMYTLAGY